MGIFALISRINMRVIITLFLFCSPVLFWIHIPFSKSYYDFAFFYMHDEKHNTTAHLVKFARAVASDLNVGALTYFAEGDQVF